MTRAEEWLCNIEKMKQKIKENGIEDVHRIMRGLEYSLKISEIVAETMVKEKLNCSTKLSLEITEILRKEGME